MNFHQYDKRPEASKKKCKTLDIVQTGGKDLKALSAERGIVIQQTNISPDQIKALLPISNGASSLSILDALDTWRKNLTNSGIHKQMWGGIISSIPPHSKRDLKFEDICSSLEENFGGVMKTSINIMKAHEAANKIPDPHTSRGDACWRVLCEHCKIIKNTPRISANFWIRGEIR